MIESSYAHFTRTMQRHQERGCRSSYEIHKELQEAMLAKANMLRRARALERIEEVAENYPTKLPTTYEEWLAILLKRLEQLR